MIQIEIGGGETPRKNGYKICDIRNLPNVDFCSHNAESNPHLHVTFRKK